MKLTVDRENLANKLKRAIKFIPSKSLITAHEHFCCTIKDNVMEIMGADGQAQAKLYCPVKSDEGWAFCVEANIFLKTISLFRENEVQISKKPDKNVLELKNGKASVYKVTMDCLPENFPVMDAPNPGNELSITQYDLKIGLKFTEKFTDDDKAHGRAYVTGININEVNKRLIFTGTDREMLCRVNVPPLAIGSWEKSIVLPQETAIKVMSLLGDKGEIAICHDNNKVIFFTDDTIERFEVTSTLVNTAYPNSEALFSKKGSDYVIINTLEFKDVFQRLRLYCSDVNADRTVKFSTNPENVNELTFTASDMLKPKEGIETITINNVSGKSINKGFDSNSMLKILTNIESNDIMFFFNESNNVASFIDPIVGANEENNFNFLITSCQ